MQKIAGFALIVIGIIMIAFTGFNFTTREKVVDAGPIQITKEKDHAIQWPPIAGGVLIAAGIIVLVIGKNKKN
ncbi:hypothetical protein [Ferruginibacter profundus]